MHYVYLNQAGKLGDYVKPLNRKSKTGFKRVQGMQIALEQTLKMYSNLEATADNCEELWTSLESVARKQYSQLTQAEKDCEATREIENWLQESGGEIAFMYTRNGISDTDASIYFNRFLRCDTESEDFIPRFLRAVVAYYSINHISAKTANTLLWEIDNLEGAALYNEALEWQAGLSNSENRELVYSQGSMKFVDNSELPF